MSAKVVAELERLQRTIDVSGQAAHIEALLPIGVRPRQLSVRTLLLGMLLALSDRREGFLKNAHEALIKLPEDVKRRLGVIAQWKSGEHELTYRQLEYTSRLVKRKVERDRPDGSPSEMLSAVTDELPEANIKVLLGELQNGSEAEMSCESQSSSYAADWTDHATWARPPRRRGHRGQDVGASSDGDAPAPAQGERAEPEPTTNEAAEPQQHARCADPEASWGRRRGKGPGQKDENFFGFYLQAVTIVKDEDGPEVPELARRILITSCHPDPPRALVPVLGRMVADAIKLSDLLADPGYAYRVAENWALPIRSLGAQLVQDLHPNDRGLAGTHEGAICCNGNLYCPATPKALFELSPLPPGASAEQREALDARCDELARYKFVRIQSHDADGYQRFACPASEGKLRCPLRASSMELSHSRPQVLEPPAEPPKCCQQRTITVPPSVNAKTAQKHDYPSAAHRRSYARRSGAERTFSTVSDRASNDLSRGFCRQMGLTANSLWLTCTFIVRNIRIADSFAARQAENERRAAAGLPPKQRKRRRQSAADPIATANTPP